MVTVLFISALVSRCQKSAPFESKRPLHIINLSFPRTGSTSFEGIFSKFPATHEYMGSETISRLLDWREKKITSQQLIAFLHERDSAAGHFIDSATFFFLAPEVVIQAFPDAKYFLSLRDCESWIISLVDLESRVLNPDTIAHSTINIQNHERYAKVFSPKFSLKIFADRKRISANLQPILADLAQFWSLYTIKILEEMIKLPSAQRLVIRLAEFNNARPKIAAFAGVKTSDLDLHNVHLNRDIAYEKIRKELGLLNLRKIARPHEELVDAWLKAHQKEMAR